MPRWRRPRPLRFDLSGLAGPPPPQYWSALVLHLVLAALAYVGLTAWKVPAGCDIAAVVADTCGDAGRVVHFAYLVIALVGTLPPAIYIRRWMTRRWPPEA